MSQAQRQYADEKERRNIKYSDAEEGWIITVIMLLVHIMSAYYAQVTCIIVSEEDV